MTDLTPADISARLRSATCARVALGRAGSAMPTRAMLDFQLAHARARDAVQDRLEPGEFGQEIVGRPIVEVASRAPDRAAYLMRPDLGRTMNPSYRQRMNPMPGGFAIVLADGLSATAVRRHGPALVTELAARAGGWALTPVVVAHLSRVAIGDDIGAALDADVVVVLIGERPGLSAADSLGAYVTWRPHPGRRDSERNCVSNIRPPFGLELAAAADEIMRIADSARMRGCTGVALLAAMRPTPSKTIEGELSAG